MTATTIGNAPTAATNGNDPMTTPTDEFMEKARAVRTQAREIINAGPVNLNGYDWSIVDRLFATALRSAVQEAVEREREAIAQEIETICTQQIKPSLGWNLAAAIRSRGQP